MGRDKSGARDPEDAPRRPRRKAKKGGAALIILAILGVLGLLGVGAAGIVLYVKYAGPSASPAGGASLAEKLGGRFVGNWEGESPERPSLKVYLEVTRDRVTLNAHNVRVNEWGDPRVYSWRPVRAEGNTLIVLREEVAGEKYQLEWTVVFASDDSMSVTSRDSGRLIANFRRVGKR